MSQYIVRKACLLYTSMEPDHCANISELLLRFPGLKIVGNAKTLTFIRQFYDMDLEGRTITVKEKDTLPLGRHTLHFYLTPMVHWPEVMMTYEESENILFSADAFGCFGALNGNIFIDELDYTQDWLAEARRYYGCLLYTSSFPDDPETDPRARNTAPACWHHAGWSIQDYRGSSHKSLSLIHI